MKQFLRPKEEEIPLWTIWEETEPSKISSPSLLWRARLVNYIASFPSQKSAEKYVASTRKFLEENSSQGKRLLEPAN